MALNFEALAGQLGIDVSPWVLGFAKAQGTLRKFAADAATALHAVEAGFRQASAGVAAIGVAVAAGSSALVKLASDAEEAASKFGFVFKDAAADVTKSLDDFSERAGRSIFKLKDMAASFGAIIGPMGFTTQATGKMSAELAKLATDLSSFFNVSESDAMMALRSAIVGEAEPMRRLGVTLSEVKIQQEAVTAGLIKNKNEMTPAIKAQAIFNILMRETATAQGDAERTGGSFANQMRRLRDGIFDAATTAGNVLLPVFTRTINLLNGMMQPVKAQAKAVQAWAQANAALLAQKTTEHLQQLGNGMLAVWNAGKRLGATVRGFLPAFSGLAQRGKDLYATFAQLWGRLPGWAKDLVLVGGTLMGVSGVIGSIGGRIPIIGDLFLMLSRLLNPLGLLRTAFSLLSPLIGALNLPLLAVAAAVGSMYFAIQKSDAARATFERIKVLARQLADTLTRIAGEVMKGFVIAWHDGDGVLANFVSGTGSLLLKTLEGTAVMLNRIADAAEMAAEVFAGDYTSAAMKAVKAMLAFEEARLGLADNFDGEDFKRLSELRAMVQGVEQEQIAAERTRLQVSAERRIKDQQDLAILRDEVMPLWDKYQRMLKNAANLEGISKPQEAARMRGAAEATLAEFRQRREALINKGQPAQKPEAKPAAAPAAKPQAPPSTPAAGSSDTAPEATEAAEPASQFAGVGAPGVPAVGGGHAAPKPDDERTGFVGGFTGLHGEAHGAADPKAAGRAWAGAFANATHEQAVDLLGKMAPDLAKAMEPNAAGKIDFTNVQKVFDQYRAVLSTMPGFTEKEFDKVVQSIQSQMFKAAQVPVRFREMFVNNISGIVKGADKVMADVSSQAQARVAGLANATGNELHASLGEQSKLLQGQLDAAKRFDPTPQQMRSLAQLRDAAIDAFSKIMGTEGKARDEAIKDAKATQQAFDKAFADIQKKGTAAFDKIGKKEQQGTAQAKAGAEATARRQRIAANNQAAASQPTAMSQVGGMANQISNMMGNAMGLAGQAGAEGHAALSNMLNTVTDPLQKLTVQITSLNAQLGMASINKTPGGTLDALRQQLSGLQHRRQMLVNKENSERAKAVTSAHEAQRQQQMEARYHEQSAHKDLNDNLSNLVIVGRRAVSSPVQITIAGVNDIREAVDRIQLELKRRGWQPGHKNTLETRKMW